MIFWALIHTQFYNYIQIRLLQKSMWHHPDGKQKYGTAGHKVLPLTRTRLADISGENPDGARFWWLLVVAVTNSPKHDFNRCKSATCRFLFRDTKSARDKNGTKPRKNKVKNTSPEISLVEYLCFVCKGTNLSLEKRGEIPISLIHNSFSYHCTPNVVIASDFDLKQHDLRKSGVKFCFALCCTFSKTRTGNRTKDLPPLLSNS